MPQLLPASPENIQRARDHLLSGGLVAFPTETVYGVGALATYKEAIMRIYSLKNRPTNKFLGLHAGDPKDVWPYVVKTSSAQLLADAFWPGPLTLVLKRCPGTALERTMVFKDETLAIRVVHHPVATALTKELGAPFVATSANSSGCLSSTIAMDVMTAFSQDKDLLVLDGGKTPSGIESTIIDLTNDKVRVLRYGAISCEEIAACLDVTLTRFERKTALKAQSYSLRLNAERPFPEEAFLAFGPVKEELSCVALLNLSPSGDLKEASRNLFPMLRQLKDSGACSIAVMPIPLHDLGAAINERLMKYQ
ncbi:MAG: threonylcarbamoyl-AMP synthase [Holosporales bacterium]|jgi:L-threonylcarbamoyladenylate synthase|nr:threonylcarbamoyl-AMP synthase [Holosporales bacterium]